MKYVVALNIWKVQDFVDEETFPSTLFTGNHNKSNVSSWESLKEFDSFWV